MRFLIVSATRAEVEPVVARLTNPVAHHRVLAGTYGPHSVDVLLTGVGMVATAVWCSRALAIGGYDTALNLGICGSFNAAFAAPQPVHVISESMPELGVEDGPAFLTLEELGLFRPDEFPFTGGRLVNDAWPTLQGLAQLPAVSGITVNTAHGDDGSIARVVQRCAPDVESMEGAGFMYACLAAGVPFAEVRAVSNRVERRNRDAWDIPGAIASLAETALRLLS
jgi:futalosine hydrolase